MSRHVLRKGTPAHFFGKTRKPGYWMLDRSSYGRASKLYLYFTCPRCAASNKLFIRNKPEEIAGHFPCLFCIGCRSPLSIKARGFYRELVKLDPSQRTRVIVNVVSPAKFEVYIKVDKYKTKHYFTTTVSLEAAINQANTYKSHANDVFEIVWLNEHRRYHRDSAVQAQGTYILDLGGNANGST